MEQRNMPDPQQNGSRDGKISQRGWADRIASILANILSYILVIGFFLLVIAVLLVQTQWAQNIAKDKVQSYLLHKLNTKVAIGGLHVSFPSSILLDNILIEDQTKDTLISGGRLKVDLDMYALLKSNIQIRLIDLEGITAKIKRTGTDTSFNYQFVVNAFASPQKNPSAPRDTSSVKMKIDRLLLNNTRIVYQDVISGDNLDLTFGHLDVPISTFDQNHQIYDIPNITLAGLKGFYYQNDPLKPKIDSAIIVAAAASQQIKLKIAEINLKDINVVYRSVPTDITTSLNISTLTAHPQNFDITSGLFAFKDISLSNSDIEVIMSNKTSSPPPPKTEVLKIAQEAAPLFTITSNQVIINNSNLKIDNTDMPVVKTGMDYGHLNFHNINVQANNFLYNGDTTRGNVTTSSLNEKSGFILNEMNSEVLLTPTDIQLKNLYAKTPQSVIRRDITIVFPGKNSQMGLDATLQDSRIAVKDIITVAPFLKGNPAFANKNDIWTLNGRIRGALNDLTLNDFTFKGLGNTALNASGTLKGLPDVNKFQAELNIAYLNTTKRDILSVLPKNTIPSNITLPDRMSMKGKIKGGAENLYANVTIASNLGNVAVNGTFQNLKSPKTMKYNATVTATNLNLGVILQDPKTYGTVSLSLNLQGQGTDFTTANIKLNGSSMSFTYNGYTYRNVKLRGSIQNKIFDITADIKDPNASLTAHVSGVYNGINTSAKIEANIDSIKTQPLHFSGNLGIYRGIIKGDFSNINPDKLSGDLSITKVTVVEGSQRFRLDSSVLHAENNGNNEFIALKTPFMQAEIKGQYKLTQLADIVQQSINPYYHLSSKLTTVKLEPYDVTINAHIYNNPTLMAFIPTLQKFDSASIAMSFSSINGINGSLQAPALIYNGYDLQGLKVVANTKNNQVNFNISFDRFKSGKQIAVYSTNLGGTIANNTIDFTANIKDIKGTNKYAFSATFNEPKDDNYVFHLKPGSILLDYANWTVNSDNTIQLNNGDIVATNFILSRGAQQLSINSIGTGTNRPLSIDFKSFDIATLTAFVQTDSALVGGRMTGNVLLKNYYTQPVFTADLTVDDFNMNKDTLGTITAKVNNTTTNVYDANIKLTGRGNDMDVTGTYNVNPANNNALDLSINIRTLQMKSLEGPSMNAIKNSSGYLNGQVAVQGTLSDPIIVGNLGFNNVAFNLTALNSYFKVGSQQLKVHNGGVNFDNFTITDSANNELKLNGDLLTTNFSDYQFDLDVNADNFQFINTTKKQNKDFYGKMVLTTDIYVHGSADAPVVDGTVTINDKTAFNIVLPQNEPSIEERKGIVQFVDAKATHLDSLFLHHYDSLNVSKFKGYNISLNVHVDKSAMFNLIIDESSGDFVNLKGEALLTAGIDPSGKITVVGTYEIEEGIYEITFKFLKRRFNIQKGSTIVWDGEPTTATLDLTGVYIANASPIDLVETQLSDASNIIKNTYRQKLPFEVTLNLHGQMLQPQITFDIRLPADKNYNVQSTIIDNVQYKLKELEADPSEMNKQVFALILLNRFVNENPFDNSNGGALDIQSYAIASVSQILNDQLNKLAKGLIDGVDLNFDLVSTDDYTTGEKRNRTDFNVGVSKRLLNDRINVTVGSDFELAGPKPQNNNSNAATADVAVDYKLSRDGRYMLRVYRKNDYQGVIEGYIIETGIGFIINVDYNNFSEIFKRTRPAKKAKKVTPPATDDKQKVSAINIDGK